MVSKTVNLHEDSGPVNVRLYARDRANLIMILNHIIINGLVSGKPTMSDAIRWSIEQTGSRLRLDLERAIRNV